MTNTSNNLSEHQAIKQTVQFYIDGALTGQSKIMSRAFSKDATIYGFVVLFKNKQFWVTNAA